MSHTYSELKSSWRIRLDAAIESRPAQHFLSALIVLNAAALGVETSRWASTRFGDLIASVDNVVLLVFLVELSLKILASGRRFFYQPWNLFDLGVVLVSIPAATQSLIVLRTFRVLRLLRLVTIVPKMRLVVEAMLAAIPGVAAIIGLLALMTYVFAIIATKLFGKDFPDWFGTVGQSMYAMIEVMTMDGWSSGFVRPMSQSHPHAWIFFLTFIFLTAYTILNLFIGIIVNAMQERHQQSMSDLGQATHREAVKIEEHVAVLRAEIEELKALLMRASTAERPTGPL